MQLAVQAFGGLRIMVDYESRREWKVFYSWWHLPRINCYIYCCCLFILCNLYEKKTRSCPCFSREIGLVFEPVKHSCDTDPGLQDIASTEIIKYKSNWWVFANMLGCKNYLKMRINPPNNLLLNWQTKTTDSGQNMTAPSWVDCESLYGWRHAEAGSPEKVAGRMWKLSKPCNKQLLLGYLSLYSKMTNKFRSVANFDG